MIGCPECKVVVWSHYGGQKVFASINVGTLDNPDACPPNFHIYTTTKQPWLNLHGDIPVFEEDYDREKYWSKDKLERREKALADAKANRVDEHE